MFPWLLIFIPLTFLAASTVSVKELGDDVATRTAFLPLDIPDGVFTAGIEAPFFIYLLYRNRNK